MKNLKMDLLTIVRIPVSQISNHLSKKEGKDQEKIQLSTKPDPGYQWENDNFKVRHNKRDQRGQPFPCRWPQGINKQTQIKD